MFCFPEKISVQSFPSERQLPDEQYLQFRVPKMWSRFLVVIVLAGLNAADFISDKQVYLSKKSRFIRFDTKDNEVEIELGISIPVVKIPLAPEVGRHGAKESGISVSAPGLVVAGVLMLTTFLVVPLLFSNKFYKDFRSSSDGAEYVWDRIQKGMHDFHSASSSCMENIICWTAKTSKDGKEGSIGKFLDDVFRSEWAERLLRGTFVEKAISAGRRGSECSKKYHNCSVVKMLSAREGHTMTSALRKIIM